MMKQRVTLQFVVLLMLFISLPLVAKVSGLPDFTELVEKAGPAVVNIRVTQFGTGGHQPRMGRNVESGAKITPKSRSFSDAISMCPVIPGGHNPTVWALAPALYTLKMVMS